MAVFRGYCRGCRSPAGSFLPGVRPSQTGADEINRTIHVGLNSGPVPNACTCITRAYTSADVLFKHNPSVADPTLTILARAI